MVSLRSAAARASRAFSALCSAEKLNPWPLEVAVRQNQSTHSRRNLAGPRMGGKVRENACYFQILGYSFTPCVPRLHFRDRQRNGMTNPKSPLAALLLLC